MPGHHDVIVNHERDVHHAYEDVRVAIRDAFKSARRQLQDIVRTMSGATKAHEAPVHGQVSELDPEKQYGFLETPDGREIYFHANSLIEGAFEDLAIGTELRFVEEQGDNGPQATTVRLAGRHHQLSS
jgi:cold shock CspA family protein